MNFVILSLDGGGIRGIMPLVILKHIEEKIQYKVGTNYHLANFVDYIAGTSTGSIIASAMLIPKYQSSIKQLTSKTIFNKKPTYIETLYDINDILELYFDLGDDIFSTNI
jgi:patatin-like phospholipase/acyl hydrolase